MREASQLRDIGMICGRSAVLTLIIYMLLGAPSRGAQISDDPAGRGRSHFAMHSGALTGWSDSPQQSRGATLSQFTPWKTRIKSVLEETKHRVIDECDLGPAMLSGQFFASRTDELPSCPLPIRPPLRC